MVNVLSAETNPGIIPAVWAVERAAIMHNMRAVPVLAGLGSGICRVPLAVPG